MYHKHRTPGSVWERVRMGNCKSQTTYGANSGCGVGLGPARVAARSSGNFSDVNQFKRFPEVT